jgi:hypothetical protein
MGQDQVETPASLSQLVADGRLRYVYWNSTGNRRGGFPGGQLGGAGGDISSWVAASCTAVPGFDTTTRNMGAPGGTTRQANGQAISPMGEMQITLYDCAAK